MVLYGRSSYCAAGNCCSDGNYHLRFHTIAVGAAAAAAVDDDDGDAADEWNDCAVADGDDSVSNSKPSRWYHSRCYRLYLQQHRPHLPCDPKRENPDTFAPLPHYYGPAFHRSYRYWCSTSASDGIADVAAFVDVGESIVAVVGAAVD